MKSDTEPDWFLSQAAISRGSQIAVCLIVSVYIGGRPLGLVILVLVPMSIA